MVKKVNRVSPKPKSTSSNAFFLSTTQRYSICCHTGIKKLESEDLYASINGLSEQQVKVKIKTGFGAVAEFCALCLHTSSALFFLYRIKGAAVLHVVMHSQTVGSYVLYVIRRPTHSTGQSCRCRNSEHGPAFIRRTVQSMQLYTVPSSALLLQTTFNICCRIVYLHVLLNFDCISTSVGRKNPKVNLTLRRQTDRPRPCCLYQPRQVPRHFPKMALLPCSLMGISVITAYYTYFLTAPTCVTNAKVILQQNCRLSGTGSSHTLQVFFGAFGRQFIQTRFQ